MAMMKRWGTPRPCCPSRSSGTCRQQLTTTNNNDNNNYTHAHIHTCTYTHIHIYPHAHTHIYTDKHTHMHTCRRSAGASTPPRPSTRTWWPTACWLTAFCSNFSHFLRCMTVSSPHPFPLCSLFFRLPFPLPLITRAMKEITILSFRVPSAQIHRLHRRWCVGAP
jgi:hypothetical protein